MASGSLGTQRPAAAEGTVPALGDAAIRRILLVRAIEEEEPDQLPPEAVEAARASAGEGALAERVQRRADYLFERLDPRRQAWAHTPQPPAAFGGLLILAAIVFGLASNSLGPRRAIHAFLNPVTALIAWNLVFYAFSSVGWIFARRGAAALRGIEPPALPGEAVANAAGRLGRLALLLARALGYFWRPLRARAGGPPAPSSGGGSRRFLALYLDAASDVLTDRVRAWLAWSAIAFALATLAGMYLRGIGFEYHVVWGSTLIQGDAARLEWVRTLFFPARLVLGAAFPGPAEVAQLGEAGGAPARIWLHVYAITTAAFVLLPRLAIALFHGLRARRRARHLALDLSEPYWQVCFQARRPGDLGQLHQRVIGDFALDADATSVLASLQAALVEADIGATPARRRAMRDVLSAKKEWRADWWALWERRFSTFPAEARPTRIELDTDAFRSAAQAVRESANPFAVDLILLELAGFEAYWPQPGRERGRLARLLPSPSLDKDVRERVLQEAARVLGRSPNRCASLRSSLQSSLRSLSRYWVKLSLGAAGGVALGALTFGIAAPALAALLHGAFHGLAAFNAVLAAIGFGALSIGHIGASGGAAILVGGGALLGLGVGSGAGAVAAGMTARAALLLAVKVEVFLREIVIGQHANWDEYGSILDELRASADALRRELPALRIAADVTADQVRERERILEVLDRVAARAETWRQEQTGLLV